MGSRVPCGTTHVQPNVTEGTIELHLPTPRDSNTNQDRVIRREFLLMLQQAGVGWASEGQARSQGDAFVEAVGAVLWKITDQWRVLDERSLAPSDFWLQYKSRRRKTHHKIVDPSTDSDDATKWLNHLESDLSDLYELKGQAWWGDAVGWHDSWAQILGEVDGLVSNLDKFLKHRRRGRKSMRVVRSKAAPAPVRDTNYGMYPPRPPYSNHKDVPEALEDIAHDLWDLPPYTPLYLSGEYLPIDKADRSKFLAVLRDNSASNVETTLFYHHRGGSQASEYWIWKCDSFSDVHLQCNEAVVARLVEEFPKMLSREDRRRIRCELDFINNLSHKKAREAAYRLMVTGATNKKTVPAMSGYLETQLMTALQTNDPELLQAIQQMGGMPMDATSYDQFWSAVKGVCDSIMQAVPDSRRNSGVGYLPADMPDDLPRSLADLYRVVVHSLDDGVPCPQQRWFEYQFNPVTAGTSMSSKHTGQFNLKWKMQGHHLRDTHPDDEYGHEMRSDLEELMIIVRDFAVNPNQDDKKKTAMGTKENPLAGTHRTRRVIDHRSQDCVDHDFGCGMSLITSVNMLADIPTSRDANWAEGQTWGIIKRSLDEGSSPWRHAVELIHCFRDAKLMDGTSGDAIKLGEGTHPDFGVIVKFHDGGSDHNTSYSTVRLAAIAEFLITGVAAYYDERCVPHKSYICPGEKPMNDVNYSYQSVTCARGTGDPAIMALLKGCKSAKSIRQKLEGQDQQVHDAVAALQQPAVDCLERAIARTISRGQRMKVGVKASKQSLLELEAVLQQTFDAPDLKLDNVTPKTFTKYPKLAEFDKHCCSWSIYLNQFIKCNDRSCTVAGCGGQDRIDPDVYTKLVKPQPLPMRQRDSTTNEPMVDPDTGRKLWVPFSQRYGHIGPDECDRPSLTNNTASKELQKIDTANKAILVKERLLAQVRCVLCGKNSPIFHTGNEW